MARGPQSGPPIVSIRPGRSPRNVKNDTTVSIRCAFQALKYAKTRFLLGLHPGPCWGSLQHSPTPPSRLGRGCPPPHSLPPRHFRHLDISASVVWPSTSLKFVHLALKSKRLDAPGLDSGVTYDRIAHRWQKKLTSFDFSGNMHAYEAE